MGTSQFEDPELVLNNAFTPYKSEDAHPAVTRDCFGSYRLWSYHPTFFSPVNVRWTTGQESCSGCHASYISTKAVPLCCLFLAKRVPDLACQRRHRPSIPHWFLMLLKTRFNVSQSASSPGTLPHACIWNSSGRDGHTGKCRYVDVFSKWKASIPIVAQVLHYRSDSPSGEQSKMVTNTTKSRLDCCLFP